MVIYLMDNDIGPQAYRLNIHDRKLADFLPARHGAAPSKFENDSWPRLLLADFSLFCV